MVPFKVLIALQCWILLSLCKGFQVDICNHDDLVISYLNLGDHGAVYVDTSSYSITKEKHCEVTLHACDECRFRVEEVEVPAPSCKSKKLDDQFSCVLGCNYVITYDSFPDYKNIHVTSGNEVTEFTSLSSEMTVKLCGGFTSSAALQLNITVEEKNELIRGRSTGTDSTGNFVSPNFPEGYALRGERFIYHLRNLDPGGRIEITFDDWDVSPLCRMLVYEGDRVSESPIMDAYGSGFPPSITSSVSSLHIVFIADVLLDARKQYMGFRATYQFLSGNTSFNNSSTDTDCGGHFRHSVGGLVNMRSGRLIDCVWVVYATLSFQHVRLSLRIEDKGRWKLVAHKGLTSTAPLLASRDQSHDNDVTRLSLTSDTGLYIRFTGILDADSPASFTYMSYNDTFQDKCDDILLKCDLSYCVSRRLTCDGVRHCDDVTDEPAYCYHSSSGGKFVNTSQLSCRGGQFPCQNGGRCLPMRMRCDSLTDCSDGSDEAGCDDGEDDTADAVTKPGAVSCGGGYVTCSSRDQCVAKRQLCDGHHQCWDRSDEQHCDHMMTIPVGRRHQRPWSLIIALPACLLSCLLLCLILALRMRKHSKSCRHRCATVCRPGRLPVISRHIPHNCTSCSGRQLLQLSRSTSGASTLVDPMTSPPPYDYSRCPASPRRMDQLSPTFCMPIPVIVEPGSSHEEENEAGDVTSLFSKTRTTVT